MKVLIITHHYLDISSGGCFASRAYINAFADIFEDILLLYPDRGKDINTYINPKVRFRGIKNKSSRLGKFLDIYRGRINRFYNTIFSQIDEFKPNMIVFDNSRSSAGYIRKIKSLGICVITIHHNYEMEYYYDTKPNILWRLPFFYYMRKAEKDAIRHSDINLTLTVQDLNLLQNYYDNKRIFNFEVVGVFEYKQTDLPTVLHKVDNISDNLIFAITGSLASYQTEICLVTFLKDYYPILLNLYPKSTLIIAGRNPSTNLITICESFPTVKLIPNPNDMTEVLKSADIYICPVSVGGGLKLRVMDGLSLGLPVLSHSISARGYDSFQQSDFMLTYNSKDSFSQGLRRIVKKINSHSDIINEYKAICSFDSGKDRIIKILKKHEYL